MSLIILIVILIIIGVALYLVNTVLPIDGKIKTIINVVVIVAVLLWLLSVFVGFDSYTVGRVGNVHRLR